MTRKDINDKIEANLDKIAQLKQDYLDNINKIKQYNIELTRKDYLLSDEEQWFTEQMEDTVLKKRPKIVENNLIGRIHWNQGFKDGDTGKIIMIERSQIVRINGEWL